MAQHMEALERANLVRRARAELKRAIKAREVLVAEVLLGELPDWLEGMSLEELCLAIPRFATGRFHALMRRTATKPTCQISDLTARKRCELGEELAVWESAAALPKKNQRQRERQRVWSAA